MVLYAEGSATVFSELGKQPSCLPLIKVSTVFSLQSVWV